MSATDAGTVARRARTPRPASPPSACSPGARISACSPEPETSSTPMPTISRPASRTMRLRLGPVGSDRRERAGAHLRLSSPASTTIWRRRNRADPCQMFFARDEFDSQRFKLPVGSERWTGRWRRACRPAHRRRRLLDANRSVEELPRNRGGDRTPSPTRDDLLVRVSLRARPRRRLARRGPSPLCLGGAAEGTWEFRNRHKLPRRSARSMGRTRPPNPVAPFPATSG